MGCDIHLYVEVFNSGVWDRIPEHALPCTHCHGTGLDPREEFCKSCTHDVSAHEGTVCLFGPGQLNIEKRPCTWYRCGKDCAKGTEIRAYYNDRNYELFGVLGGVRGRSRAGFTRADIGLPPNVSEGIKNVEEEWGRDAHSRTWYTLTELLTAPVNWEAEFPGFFESIKEMQKLPYPPDKIRVVIWFDN